MFTEVLIFKHFTAKLNQVELIKQFVGSWQSEIVKDTMFIMNLDHTVLWKILPHMRFMRGIK